MKIGIYGGTFNPVHIGHTSLAESLVTQGLVDEVWLLVSPLNPFKQADKKEFASYDDRFLMTVIATKNMKGLKASDFENHLPVPSYMLNTLNALAEAFPQHDFSLVIGADNWVRFKEWYKSDEILANYNILIYCRPGFELDKESISRLGGNIKIVDTPLYNISSTQIRDAIKKGEKPTEWLSPNVLKYIHKRNLYK